MKKKIQRTILITALISGLFPIQSQEQAEQGILHHTEMHIRKNGFIPLKGEWDFFWKDFAEAGEIRNNSQPIMVPGNWAENKTFPAEGYGTYRIQLRDLVPGQIYSLYVPEMLTAFKIFHNDQELGANGVIGKTRNQSVPEFLPFTVDFTARNENTLTIWVSNFHYRKSGIWRNIFLGTPSSIHKMRQNRMLLDMFLFGVLLFVSVYHIAIYIFRKEENAQLYFGLICLIIAIRIISTGEQLLAYAVPALPWEITRRLEFSPFALAPILLPLYMKSLFPSETKQWHIRVSRFIGIITGGLFFILPVRISNKAILHAEIILVLVLLYSIYVITRAVINKRIGSYMILSAMFILLLTSLNDVFYSNQIFQTFYMSQIGFIIFIIMQAVMLTRRYAYSFKTIENLTLNLKDFNSSLSRFVPFQFLEYLNKGSILEVFLGDQVHKNMTILFADIRSFTTLSENMTPEENFRFLNSFLSNVVPVIREENGFVDKFMGDGIMALFPESPDHALKAAVSLQNAVLDYNRNRDRAGYRMIKLGIGIHTGGIMLGTIGEHDRMETTVISDTVNIASRMEEMTKTFGASIIISKQTYQILENPDEYHYRYLGPVEVKGKKNEIEILEVLDGLSREEFEKKDKTREIFTDSVNYFIQGNYAKSLLGFHKVLESNPDDKGASYFIERCARKSEK